MALPMHLMLAGQVFPARPPLPEGPAVPSPSSLALLVGPIPGILLTLYSPLVRPLFPSSVPFYDPVRSPQIQVACGFEVLSLPCSC
ncbi:hypothetical protein AMTR_s00097p00162320 [Amborella trichopoda]|uniref:Uncharacterized protein n=1 Tax=Amborella trichopoda TaxID=13333 RepID=W1P2B7_AMBTC|nr:hypothetical protein AMTR_s00097p00162320 [Amborella trichopoda]